MRPERQRKHLRSAAVARGRMFLKAQMGWVPGFPLDQRDGYVEWVTLPRHGERVPERVRLDREHLQQATHTWSTLVHRFPRVLSQVVDDRDGWQEGVPRMLEWLKGAIHRGENLPASLLDGTEVFSHRAVADASAMARSNPDLRPMLYALSWTTFLTPKDLPQALAWVETNAHAVETLLHAHPGTDGIVAVLLFWELARRDGNRRVASLLHLAGDPLAFTLKTRQAAHHVESCANALRRVCEGKIPGTVARLPDPDIGAELLRFSTWLIAQNQPNRRRVLDVFALLLPDDMLMQWAAWWDEVHPLLKRARRLRAIPPNESTREEAEQLVLRLKALHQEAPVEPHIHLLLQHVRETAAPEQAALHRQICRTLQRLPHTQRNDLVRAAFLPHWLALARWYPNKIIRFLQAFRGFLVQHRAIPSKLAPWGEVIHSWNRQKPRTCWGVTEDILVDVTDQRLWPVVFDALARCSAAHDALSADAGARVARLVTVTRHADRAATYFSALIDGGLGEDYLDVDMLRCAHVLDAGGGRFGLLVAALHRASRDDDHLADAITTLATHLGNAGWTGLAADLILDGELPSLHTLGQRVAVLQTLQRSINITAPSATEDPPAWSHRYPETLRTTLARLVALTPDAEQIATRILDTHFPNPTSLRQEITTIESLLATQPDNANLARRLDNLRNRLASPRLSSPNRLAKLQAKLDRAMRREVLHTWQAHVNEVLRAELGRLLQVDEVPSWVFASQHMDVLEALFTLPRASRDLALRLLHRRCGPAPWNLLDAPANQAFLTRLQARGIDPVPWIQPPAPTMQTGTNGRQVRLVFEADPLEIFQMGAHFNTCLRPGGMNFFSVFANAADINKHIVYARDEQGRVVGRCLMALSDSGGLLTFEPFCHDPTLGFDTMMGVLAEELAARMGAVVISRGTVPCLVSSDWYDDGPRDLCNRFAFLQSGSSFRDALSEIEIDAFVPTLKTLFHPLPLNALSLPLVLELPELKGRPDLVVPLLPVIEACKGLSADAWLQAAHLAHQAGATGFSHRVLRSHAVPHLLHVHRRHAWLPSEPLRLLAEMEPSMALQVVRRTRPRGVRTDEDETDPERRSILAQAHERLGRSLRAQRLRAR